MWKSIVCAVAAVGCGPWFAAACERVVTRRFVARSELVVTPFAVPVAVPVAVVGPVWYSASEFTTAGIHEPAAFGVAPLAERAVAARSVDRPTPLRDAAASVLLRNRCGSCHGATAPQGRLRIFDDQGAVLKLPRAVVLERITATDPAVRMPPQGEPLSAADVAILREWARAPRDLAW